jgi:hypothetical protein
MIEINTPITFYYAQLPHLLKFSVTLCEKCFMLVKEHLSCGTRFKLSMILSLPHCYIQGITQGQETFFYGKCPCNGARYSVYGYSFKGKIIPERQIKGDQHIANVEFHLSNTVARILKKSLLENCVKFSGLSRRIIVTQDRLDGV